VIPVSHVKLHTSVFLLIVFASAQPGFGAQTTVVPSVSEIIRRSLAMNTADWNAQPQYSFRELDIKSKVDLTGSTRAEESKTREVMMLEGSPYYRLIGIDNEPLSRAQQQQEQLKLNREIERRQNESPRDRDARLSKYRTERSEEHLLMQQMIAAFQFRLAGEQSVDGADCYVLDALPNPDYRPPVQRARVLTGMKGRLWIEKSHYHWAKVQAEVITPVEFGLFIAKVKPGTKFELDQAPVGDVWLPKCFTQSVNAIVLGLYGMRSMEEEHYSHYHQTMLNASR